MSRLVSLFLFPDFPAETKSQVETKEKADEDGDRRRILYRQSLKAKERRCKFKRSGVL